jgi:hypothetical protein
MTIWPRRPYAGAARSLWTCLLALMVGASVAGAAPSSAGAVAIANDFTGTGTLKLQMDFFEDDFIKCTSSTIKGTVSKPIPDAKATISSWSTEGCAIYRKSKNVGSATVKVTTLPVVEAVNLKEVFLGKFTADATFKIGESTCKPKFTVSTDLASYTNGSTTNKIESFANNEFVDSTFPLPEVCEFANGAQIAETIVSFPDPQFEVEEGNYKSPTVVTKAASELTQTSARLNGEITPNGLSTEYHFEYGLTEGYGTNVPVSDALLTSNLYAAQPVFKTVSGLLPGTIYHFRLVAKNAKGTSYGLDQAFATSPSTYRLRDSNSAGPPDYSFDLTDQQPGDRPISGDWNGDGIDTVGFYRPSNYSFYLRNSNSSGPADIVFPYGNPEDLPVAGDWNEDGIDTIGVYRPSEYTFYLRNFNSTGAPQYQFKYGNPGDLPIAGDWNNSGTDTIGLYRPSTGVFYLSNVNAAGPPDYSFAYGNPNNDDLPVAGDWDENGFFSIGIYRKSTGEWFLDNELPGDHPISYVFSFGTVGHTTPIVGDWNNSGTDTPGAVWK